MISVLPRLGALLALLVPASRAGVAPSQEHEPVEHAATQTRAPEHPVLSVSRQESKDGPRWSVLCEDTALDELVRALAKKSGLALEGAELLPYGTRVSVDLARRPLEQILEFVLGSQGLRFEIQRGSLRVLASVAEPEDLLLLAQNAWQKVEAEGDAHAAARAKLARGNLCEVRGDLEGAYRLYAELAEEDAADESIEALYRAGRVLERLGHWAEAAQHFRTLAAMDGAKAFHARARLELARVSIELGDAPSALHVLNFLEANFPSSDPVELAERRLVRAAACIATSEFVEALRTLEEGEVVSAPHAQTRSLQIRAQAFEGLGYDVEAARAWLIFAREGAEPDERLHAFEKAAQLSLAAGDELGTLFVCREAAKAGADEGLGSFARQARLRLGLDEEEVPGTIQERLTLAESLLAEQPHKAADLFEGLYLARGALPESDQARVLAGWAHVLLDRAGLEAAIEILSKARASFQDPLAAQTLDLAAAALFESEGRFDQAADAYRGNY